MSQSLAITHIIFTNWLQRKIIIAKFEHISYNSSINILIINL